jgi:hypothetical protein
MKADLATIGPEATLKARRCVGPTRATNSDAPSMMGELGRLFPASKDNPGQTPK